MRYIKFLKLSTDTGVEYQPGRIYAMKDSEAGRWLKRAYTDEVTEADYKSQNGDAVVEEKKPAKALKKSKPIISS